MDGPDLEDANSSRHGVPRVSLLRPGNAPCPFAKSYLRRIDLEGKRVEMALPEGLVDLNAPEA